MLKLLKYNFKSFISKHLIVTIIIFINLIIYLTTKEIINNLSEENEFILILINLQILSVTLFYGSLIALPVLTLILSIYRFKKKVLGDEGYLTHTLPLQKADILNASILNLLVYLIIDVLIIIISLTAFFGVDSFTTKVSELFSKNPLFVISIIMLLTIAYVTFYNQIILAFTLGYSHETKKIKYTIIYGLVIYVINQAFGSFLVAIIFIASKILSTTSMEIVTMFASSGLYLVVFIISYIIMNQRLNKKLNLE